MDLTKSYRAGSVSSLRSSRGAVYLNPDGTFVYRTAAAQFTSKPIEARRAYCPSR